MQNAECGNTMKSTTIKTPEHWGLCMAGNEQLFTDTLIRAAYGTAPSERFNYHEIGFGGGWTMRAAGEVLAQLPRPFQLVGYDLPDGWSMDRTTAEALLQPTGWKYQLILESGRHVLTRAKTRLNIDVAFIDGCHGAPCVVADFMAVAAHVAPGGCVIFNDASPRCQGHHMQPHCGTGIDVRAALNQLGLLEDWLPGWRLVAETIDADHGIAVIQKENE